MADNVTVFEGALDSLNITASDTVPPETIWETLLQLDFLLLEAKLVFSALGIIYLGSHAALRRPPSAAPSKPRRPGQKDHDEDEDRVTQGLELSDAILFPVMAGIMLVGLYYLIQWLKDPEILNKVLRWYMSSMSIVSMLTLYAHGIDFATSFVFPRYWRGRDGSLRKIDQKDRVARLCDDVGNQTDVEPASRSPLPSFLCLLAPTGRMRKLAWDVRGLFTQEWLFKLYVHGMGEEKAKIKFSHMIALLASVGTAIVYSSTTSPFLSNVLGYGLCYGSFLILSPTDLLTGTLVLTGLFFYDIIMVFYTPYMVTVATTLDVPIKLTFQAAARKSILGLGDIVLPGIVMGWALRLDLWLHYQRKIKYEATDLKIIEKDATSGAIVTRSETKHKEIKAPYVNAQGAWADRFWAQTCMIFGSKPLPAEVAASKFPKTYFHATVGGYSLGMGVTLAMLLVFKRGQPALLYLVPGVLGSLYLTAMVRGELKQIWAYTEDGSIDTRDVVVDLDGDGRAVKKVGKLKDGVVDTTKDGDKDKETDGSKDEKKDGSKDEKKDGSKRGSKGGEEGVKDADGECKKPKKGHKVFYVSLETPSEAQE
ncbi:hypothetical protein ACO1O0_005562 [Amphichorda felina]